LVFAQPISEVPEGLMNYPVFVVRLKYFTTNITTNSL